MNELGQTLERELTKTSNFPKRVQFARLRQKESRDSLARSVGVSDAAIWQWEHGGNLPQKQNLINLAKALHVNLAWLKDGVGEMMATSKATASIGEKTGLKAKDLATEEAPDGMNVVARLRWCKEKSGLSYPQLAAKSGISESTIGNNFTNPDSQHFRNPSETTLKLYAKAFNVELDWLMHGTGKVSAEEPELNSFRERALKALRDMGQTQAYLAKQVGVHESTIRGYLINDPNRRYPDTKMYGKLAQALDVDVSWLRYGEKGEPVPVRPERDLEAFKARLRKLAEADPKPSSAISTELGRSASFVSQLLTGDYFPQYKNQVLLADYFGVNHRWLMTGEGPKTAADAAPLPSEAMKEAIKLLDDQFATLPEPELPDDESPAAKYFDKPEVLPVRVAMVSAEKLQMFARRITRLTDEQDRLLEESERLRNEAIALTPEIKRWTEMLMAETLGDHAQAA